MSEPRAITFKEVKKVAKSNFEAGETWRKIGEITEAGHVPASDDATIDLTEISEAKQAHIDRLLGQEESSEAEASETKKRGNK